MRGPTGTLLFGPALCRFFCKGNTHLRYGTNHGDRFGGSLFGHLQLSGTFRGLLVAVLWMVLAGEACHAQNLISYQGRILISGNAFTGTGQFKFALVGPAGSPIFWGNSPDNNSDGQPDTPVSVSVNAGLFTVFLGDTNLAGMSPLPVSVFTNASLHLRIWFNDGVHGIQQLTPDQVVASAAYALNVAAVSARVDALTSQFSNSVVSGSTITSLNPQDTLLQSEGFQLFTSIPAPGWITSSASDSPSATIGQAGVWTGQQLLVWGGNLGAGIDSSAGASYWPALDQWQPIFNTNAPSARNQHTAVWSGQEMLVWGGASGGLYVNTGGRFNPSNQVWLALSTNTPPSGRTGHIALWTGSRMVIWGGRNSNGIVGDGAAYDPVADQWTTLPAAGAPSPRFGATAVWAANRILIWGGTDQTGSLNTGAQLLCDVNGVPTGWAAVSAVNCPSGRSAHSAVWTGQKMLVWGGQGGGNFLSDGAVYDPVANLWSPITSTNAPAARGSHAAVWSGQELLVFGGETYLGTLADGGAFDPAAGTWRTLSSTGSPQARSGCTAAWDGTELLLFGGQANGSPVPSLQRLNPQPTWYFYRKP